MSSVTATECPLFADYYVTFNQFNYHNNHVLEKKELTEVQEV